MNTNPDVIENALAVAGLLPDKKTKKMVRREITLPDGSVLWARISRLTPRKTERASAPAQSGGD
jgi:hypothetical protein